MIEPSDEKGVCVTNLASRPRRYGINHWIGTFRFTEGQMFEGGRDKKTVLDAVMNLHRPKEYWEQKAKEAVADAKDAPKA